MCASVEVRPAGHGDAPRFSLLTGYRSSASFCFFPEVAVHTGRPRQTVCPCHGVKNKAEKPPVGTSRASVLTPYALALGCVPL